MKGLDRILRPLRNRMATMIGRAILAAVNAATGIQTVRIEVLAGDVVTGAEHMEPYGFTSNPHPGAEGVALNTMAQRGSVVVVNLGNRQFRLTDLKTGEVALYTDEKDSFVFHRGNRTTLQTKHYQVTADDDSTLTTKTNTVKTEVHQVAASSRASIIAPDITFGSETGGGATARMNADIDQTGRIDSTGDHVAGGISLIHHVHVCPNCGQTGKPVGGA